MDTEEPERSTQPVRIRLDHGGRAHELTLSAAADGRIAVVIGGADADGTATTELYGTIEAGDLGLVGRLLLLASDADFAYQIVGASRFVVEQRRHHPNAYRPWTEIDDQQLAVRAAAGAPLPELVEEFGRKQGAIRSRLARLEAAAGSAD